MRVGSLVEWRGADGEIEEGYGIVLDINDKHIKVYWLRIEDETHLTLADGTVTYINSVDDYKRNRIVEVICNKQRDR